MLLHSHPKARGELLRASKSSSYCPHCTSILLTDETACFDCHKPKPQEGWPSVDQYAYPLLGSIIQDRYLVTGFMDSGAHAQVYRVWSLHISRTFAIKIIDLDEFQRHEQEELVVRMQREIDALASLHNPHIVALHDVVELSPKAVGLVMEFIDGSTLSDVLKEEGKIAWPRALRLVRQLALAIQSLHELGVVHRDIKPENVMVSKLAAQMEFIRLLDFGLVSGKNRVTSDFIGTPLHASPEICSGGLEVDARSDIYSLGSVLFLLITGHPPINGGSIFEIIYKKVSNDAPRASTLIELPTTLDELLARLLSRDRAERPDSIEELIALIDKILDENAGARYNTPLPLLAPSTPPVSVVVVADQDPNTFSIFNKLLTAHQITCHQARHADELLELCARHHPQIVFVSTSLPQASESQVFKVLKRRTMAKLFIIADKDAPAELLDAFELAGIQFVVKPLNSNLLLDFIGLNQ